jgi:hypothetical protein
MSTKTMSLRRHGGAVAAEVPVHVGAGGVAAYRSCRECLVQVVGRSGELDDA